MAATTSWLYTSANGEREVLRVETGAAYGLFRGGGKPSQQKKAKKETKS